MTKRPLPSTPDQWLSPAETAAALGITVRALRIYEQRGLVTPHRTKTGWRTYGPEALTRLHQILALKNFGLSLASIGDLLNGRYQALDSVLSLQERVLHQQAARVRQAARLLAAARAKLAAGEELSLNDLAQLTRETITTEDAARKVFSPLVQKYFAAEEGEAFLRTKFDPRGAGLQWSELNAEARALMAKSDANSAAAADLARRWKAQVDIFSGGDPDTNRRANAMWTEALSGPHAADLPLDMAVFAFVRRASIAARIDWSLEAVHEK